MENQSSSPPKIETSGSKDSSQHDGCCPICFQDEDLAVAPCQHVFCVPCLERILLSGGNVNQAPVREIGEFVSPDYPAGREQNIEELKIPAWNACPICRQPLFLWDLRRYRVEVTSMSTPKSDDTASGDGNVKGPSSAIGNEDPSEEGAESTSSCSSAAKAVASIPPTVGKYLYSRESPKWDEIPFLKGSTWLESTNGVAGRAGYGSFHFPPHADDPDLTVPYYNLEQVSHKRLMFRDCLYHAKSHILSASLHSEDEMDLDESSYRLILAFSADGGLVRSGALVVEQPVWTPARHVAQFPFDGFYNFQDERLTVVGHKCILNGQPLLLQKSFEVDEDYSDSINSEDTDLFPVNLLKLITPERRVVGTMELTTGVGAGAQLVWNLRGSLSPIGTRRTWKWLRESTPSAVTDRLPRHKIHRWGGPYARRWLKRQGPLPHEDGSRSSIPTFHGDTIWGNVFCQAFKIGLASYHFVPPADGEEIGSVYISYENPSTSEWPPLDNGQPIPAKVYFHNVSFPNARNFRGHILWQEDFGTPWQGMIRWEYEMIFDEKFTCIVGGSVTSFEVHSPDVPRELSRYGESLVYVNAALYREFRRLVTEEESTAGNTTTEDSATTISTIGDGNNRTVNEDWTDRFRTRSLELRLRLQRENAPVRTIAMVHRLMTIAYQGEAETCPIDYNLHDGEEQEEIAPQDS
mmetsp:Transcript_14030/g.28307  ORF Transcript_14030/g.28307 Transcript_14030/m.28307 type:complete len:692 (+) Transcript_14030:130-2205(+)